MIAYQILLHKLFWVNMTVVLIEVATLFYASILPISSSHVALVLWWPVCIVQVHVVHVHVVVVIWQLMMRPTYTVVLRPRVLMNVPFLVALFCTSKGALASGVKFIWAWTRWYLLYNNQLKTASIVHSLFILSSFFFLFFFFCFFYTMAFGSTSNPKVNGLRVVNEKSQLSACM